MSGKLIYNKAGKAACVTISLVFIFAFIVIGCKQSHDRERITAELNLENTTIADYASQAIEAAGGLRAWMRVKKLERTCVVTFYQGEGAVFWPNPGSFYLTTQCHVIFPWSNSIRISAQEPKGKFIWQFSDDTLSILQAPGSLQGDNLGQVDSLPIAVSERCFAEAILCITTAPIRLLASNAKFTKDTCPVKIEGLWYYPIERAAIIGDKQQDTQRPSVLAGPSYWSKVVFYQNRDSFLVDIVWFANADRGRFFAVRGYDYHPLEEMGIYVPSKIEIFETNSKGIFQRRLVSIDYF